MAKAPSYKTLIKRMKNISGYLNKYSQNERPFLFEELVIQGFARLLNLPYYDSSDDDPQVAFKATWNGCRRVKSQKAPPGPDGIILAHDFFIVVEATTRPGSTQWTMELGGCIRHAKDASSSWHCRPEQIFTILITEKIHEDTFNCIQASNANKQNPFKIVPLEIDLFGTMIETSFLALTIRHIEVSELFRNIIDQIEKSSSDDHHQALDQCIVNWQRRVLALEKYTTVAIKSYEAMININRPLVSVSEILQKLETNLLLLMIA